MRGGGNLSQRYLFLVKLPDRAFWSHGSGSYFAQWQIMKKLEYNYSFYIGITTLRSCSPIGWNIREKPNSLPFKDWGSWALTALEIYCPCRCVHLTSQHFKTSQAVTGDIIHPACSYSIKLMLSVSDSGIDSRERNHPVHGQLKDIQNECHFMKKTFSVPQWLRNFALHMCLMVCVYILRVLITKNCQAFLFAWVNTL